MTNEILVGTLPDVVMPEERARLHDLGLEYKRLKADYESLCYDCVRFAYVAARDVYIANPTAESFALMQRASHARHRARNGEHRVAKQAAKIAWAAFAAKTLGPIAAGIIERALKLARATLAEVKSQEESRCLSLTGRALRHSDVVDCASALVARLEKLASGINGDGVTRSTQCHNLAPETFLMFFGQACSETPMGVKPSSEESVARRRNGAGDVLMRQCVGGGVPASG